MHVPGGPHHLPWLLLNLTIINSVAIEPETQALFVLDAEIIAREPLPVRPPPFHRDALRPLGAAHRMRGAAPDEACGRSVRHLRDHLDLLRTVKQPQWPQRRLALHAPGPDGLLGCGK